MKQRVYNKLIFIFSSKIAGTIVTGVFLLGTTIATGVISTHYKFVFLLGSKCIDNTVIRCDMNDINFLFSTLLNHLLFNH
jgi:hypothetical protein